MVVGLYQVLAGLLFCLKQRAQLGKSPKLQREWFPQQTPRIPLALPPQYINAATANPLFVLYELSWAILNELSH